MPVVDFALVKQASIFVCMCVMDRMHFRYSAPCSIRSELLRCVLQSRVGRQGCSAEIERPWWSLQCSRVLLLALGGGGGGCLQQLLLV